MSTQTFNHLSDSHGSDIDYEEVLEEDVYETGDLIDGENQSWIDAVTALDEEIAQRDRHAGESDSEWYLIPGNHDLTEDHSQAPSYEEIREQVDEDISVYSELTGKDGEDPEDAETIYDVVISQYDNIVDARDTVVENGDCVVYFGNSHQDPELQDPDARDKGFGYDFEEIAEEMEEQDPTEDFGLLDYLNPRNWGTILESFGKDYEVDPDELDLSDIPDELMTEEHQAYREEKEKIINQIEGYDKPVVLADHAVTRDEEWNYSSDINRELAEEGYVDMVLGGHDHSHGMKEVGDANVINSAKGYSEIELEDGVYSDHTYTTLEGSGTQSRPGGEVEIEEAQEIVAQEAPEIPEEQADEIGEMMAQRGIPADQIPEIVRDMFAESPDQSEQQSHSETQGQVEQSDSRAQARA